MPSRISISCSQHVFLTTPTFWPNTWAYTNIFNIICTIWLQRLAYLVWHRWSIRNRNRKKSEFPRWWPLSNVHWVSPVVVISAVCSTQPQGCLFSKGCCKIINVTLKDVSSTWLPSLSSSLLSFSLFLVAVLIPAPFLIWINHMAHNQCNDSHTALFHWMAQVGSIIFVCCRAPENKWKLPLDFHTPSEAPHVSPRHSDAKGLWWLLSQIELCPWGKAISSAKSPHLLN